MSADTESSFASPILSYLSIINLARSRLQLETLEGRENTGDMDFQTELSNVLRY